MKHLKKSLKVQNNNYFVKKTKIDQKQLITKNKSI